MTDNITLPRADALHIRDVLLIWNALARRPADKAALAAIDAALAEPEPDAIAAKYNELLMAVAQKHPDETRHETALRYITQAENQSNAPDRAQEVKP
jgi:hypothetical protein